MLKYILLNEDNTVKGRSKFRPSADQRYTTDQNVWAKYIAEAEKDIFDLLGADARNYFYHLSDSEKNAVLMTLIKANLMLLRDRIKDQDIESLEKDDAELEKVAREKFHMKRKNEKAYKFKDKKDIEKE